jgi:hypothetical protein
LLYYTKLKKKYIVKEKSKPNYKTKTKIKTKNKTKKLNLKPKLKSKLKPNLPCLLEKKIFVHYNYGCLSSSFVLLLGTKDKSNQYPKTITKY